MYSTNKGGFVYRNRHRFKAVPSMAAIVWSGLAMFSPSASAQSLSFQFFPASYNTSAADGTLTLFGAITNNSASTVFLNDARVSISSQSNLNNFGVTSDITSFFNNAPISLAPSASYGTSSAPLAIFNIQKMNALADTYNGVFTIVGGNDANTFNDLASASFSVVVAAPPVPESSSNLLLQAGLFCLAGTICVRRLGMKRIAVPLQNPRR